MSRLAPPRAIPRAPAASNPTSNDPTEICPVCKSSRYLTPSLRFLINPECYHKMCESCVDRLFAHGPASCPIPGCGRTLRKARFRAPTFSDLQVEREVDVRRKVGAVFNRREEEFEDLRAWNDYLNEVEDITFNLVHGVEIAETEKRFEAYARAHRGEIEENKGVEEREREMFVAGQREEREMVRRRREAVRREVEEERREVEVGKREVLRRLEGGMDAEVVAREGVKVQLKKRMDRAAAAERQRKLQAGEGGAVGRGSGGLIKGLKARRDAEVEETVDPFGGLRFEEGRKYFQLQDEYAWAGVRETKADVLIGAGGYDVSAFTSRALCEAFAGLGVFVADEVDGRERVDKGEDDIPVAAGFESGAAKGMTKDVKMEDPF